MFTGSEAIDDQPEPVIRIACTHLCTRGIKRLWTRTFVANDPSKPMLSDGSG
jgi:hypothetical protein